MIIRPEFPEKLAPLFQPKRYKVLYGGRGGAKSWGIARGLLLLATAKTMRIGCFREIQKSIKESVHALLKGQVEALGLGSQWEIQETRIINRANGSEFVFAGLRALNVENIKSYEGLDVAWVEEARNVSKRSWDILIPTIRKPGSEIWVSLNPELDTDETYVRFIKNAANDNDVLCLEMSWRDNPWFPEVLENERLRMERNDPDGYLTTWEGKCRQFVDGAIYAAEIRRATQENRITRVPYEPTRPVHTFWDLGWSDATAIWCVQAVGLEYRVLNYIEDYGRPLDHYVRKLREFPYLWGTDWLPHDARAKSLQTGKSVEEILRDMGRDVRIVPQLTVVDGINAGRLAFNKSWFDERGCSDGLNRLRRYAYEIDENGQRSKMPAHDENSHGADAWRYLGVGFDQHGSDRDAAPGAIMPKFVKRAGIV